MKPIQSALIILSLLVTQCSIGQAISDTAGQSESSLVLGGLKVGTKAPPLKVAEWLSEKPDMKGKFIALDFWGPYCKPCIAGFTHINALNKAFKDKVNFIAITTNDDPVSIYTFDGPAVNFYSAMITPSVFSETYNVQGIPYMLVIDPMGMIRFSGNGHDLTVQKLDAMLAQ